MFVCIIEEAFISALKGRFLTSGLHGGGELGDRAVFMATGKCGGNAPQRELHRLTGEDVQLDKGCGQREHVTLLKITAQQSGRISIVFPITFHNANYVCFKISLPII